MSCSPTLCCATAGNGPKDPLDQDGYYRQDEIDPLCAHAVHVHLRQARPGALQAKFGEGVLNFPALFGALRDAGYAGALTLEAVHQAYMNTLGDDVMTETIALRDAFNAWNGDNREGR
ncbi:MAG: hypothetical protein IT542_07110 [Rubellimicrobium sp.]|nr:hypothetical protein [Rubellimicrobium sp.]